MDKDSPKVKVPVHTNVPSKKTRIKNEPRGTVPSPAMHCMLRSLFIKSFIIGAVYLRSIFVLT